jgi:hypothetical protein
MAIIDYQEEFYKLIQFGKLAEIIPFYEQHKLHIDISAGVEEAFRDACGRGHLDLAQWLYQTKPTIYISAFDGLAFRGACMEGHLDVAQWLYTIKPNINISHSGFDQTFRFVCYNQHLDVAQWLQTLIPYGLYYTFEVDENNKITSYSNIKLNYSFLKNRFDTVHTGNEICFREALVRNRFHPKYMDKWVDWGHEEHEDFDMMA